MTKSKTPAIDFAIRIINRARESSQAEATMVAYLRQENHRLQLSGALSDKDRLELAIITGEADPLLQPAQYLKEQLGI